jgi:chromosome segregation ATPase
VTVERRQRGAHGAHPGFGHLCWIVEASFEEPSPAGAPARLELERRGSMDGLEDRQRVDRWIEESQYLLGRLVPGLLDDRDRLKSKLEAAEEECARLRHEAGEFRKEISDLQSETQYFRSEHVAMADALREVIEHVGQIQKPLNDVHRRLQVTQPALSSATA